MKLMDLNVRLDVPSDGPNNYQLRKPLIEAFIHEHDPDLIALQEYLPHMMADLNDAFSDTYHIYSMPRDGYGEQIPIMVKKSAFEIIFQSTYWLSETPDMPSKIDGSMFPRIMCAVVLKRHKDGKQLLFVNTHLDYDREDVILRQAQILHQTIEHIRQTYLVPVIISGDFNQTPNARAIRFLSSRYINIFKASDMMTNTFHDFTSHRGGEPIDYIFLSNDVMIDQFAVMQSFSKENPLSDHYPLMMTFDI